MESNILPGEPTISETTVSEEVTESGAISPKARKIFSIGVFAFAVWYFGFRNKGKK